MIASSLGAAHVTAAILALGLGLVVLLAQKGTPFHGLFGAAYATALVVVNISALGLYRLTGQFGPFHALALLSFAVVVSGVLAVLRRRENWPARHYQFMAYSYLGLWAGAVAEAVARLKLLGPLASGSRGSITVGMTIAILFAALGYLVIPRLQPVALRGLAHDKALR
jgi:uncharacterized membrane protein